MDVYWLSNGCAITLQIVGIEASYAPLPMFCRVTHQSGVLLNDRLRIRDIQIDIA